MLRKLKEEPVGIVLFTLSPSQLHRVAGGGSLPNLSSISPETWAAIAQHDANQVPKGPAAQ